MNNDSVSEKSITVISPRFSLLNNISDLDILTADSFSNASPKERDILFRMRKSLDSWSSAGNDITNILPIVKNDLSDLNIPQNMICLFPGLVEELPKADDGILQLAHISENITVDLLSPSVHRLLQYLSKSVNANLISAPRISEDNAEAILNYISSGIRLTVCNRSAVAERLNLRVASDTSLFDIYGSTIVIPGKTAVKCVPVDIKSQITQCDGKEAYDKTKLYLRGMIETEEALRYAVSSKGKSTRRRSEMYNSAAHLGILYENFISPTSQPVIQIDRKEFNILNFHTVSAGEIDQKTEFMLRCISTACEYLDGFYKISPISSLTDIRHADNTDDLKRIIKEHTAVSKYMLGGSLLELSLTDSLSDPKVISSFINEFFGFGGMAVKIKLD